MRRRARDCCRTRLRASIPTVANLNPAMLPYMSFWPQPNGPELLSSGSRQRRPRMSPTTIRTRTSARTSAPCAPIMPSGERDSLSAAYTIDNGNSLIPQADPLFASYETLQSAGGQHAGDAHLLAADPEHVHGRLLARRLQLRFRSAGAVSVEPDPSSPATGPGASWSAAA